MEKDTGYVDMLKDGEKKLKDILKYLGPDEDVDKQEYESFVKALTDSEGFPEGEQVVKIDKKVRAVLNLGLKDGDMTDEVISVSPVSLPVSNLIPTQSQIGLLDSIGYIAFVIPSKKQLETIPTYLSGNPNLGGGRIITANSKYIIDGHHRWSGVYIINPSSKIDCFNLDMKGFKDPEKMLATVQLAIAGTFRAIYMKNANSESDIFNYSGDIKELVEKVLTGGFGLPKGAKNYENCSTFIQIMAGVKENDLDLSAVGKPDDEVKQIIKSQLEKYPQVLERLTENAKGILSRKPAEAPMRVAMPQPSDTAKRVGELGGDLPQELQNKLKTGALNFKDPIFVDVEKALEKNIESSKWIKTFEQFRNKR